MYDLRRIIFFRIVLVWLPLMTYEPSSLNSALVHAIRVPRHRALWVDAEILCGLRGSTAGLSLLYNESCGYGTLFSLKTVPRWSPHFYFSTQRVTQRC